MSSIAFTAAVHCLARKLLITKTAAFNLAVVPWHDLARSDQEFYLYKAQAILNDLAPDGYHHELERPEPEPASLLRFRRNA